MSRLRFAPLLPLGAASANDMTQYEFLSIENQPYLPPLPPFASLACTRLQ